MSRLLGVVVLMPLMRIRGVMSRRPCIERDSSDIFAEHEEKKRSSS